MISNEYAAGFFDGEGCVMVMKSQGHLPRPNYSLKVAITNTDLEVLREFQQKWGGYVYQMQSKTKSRWQWQIARPGIVRFLEAVYPYLYSKKEQVEIALSYNEIVPKSNRGRGSLSDEQLAMREGFYLALREAKN